MSLEQELENFMDQDANFIKTQEGYPNFFRNLPDALSNVQFCNGTSLYSSRKFGVLDFFDSLSHIPQIASLVEQGEAELKNTLKPGGSVEVSAMNTIYLEKLHSELLRQFE